MLVVGLLLGLFASILQWDKVVKGFSVFSSIVLKGYNNYYGWVFHINDKNLILNEYITLPFCVFAGILAVLLSFCYGHKNRPIIGLVIVLPSLLLPLLCGKAPGISGVIAIGCSLLCILFNAQADESISARLKMKDRLDRTILHQTSVNVSEEYSKRMKAGITTTALLFGVILLMISEKKIYADYKKEIQAYQDSFSEVLFLEKLKNISGLSLGVYGNTGLDEGRLGSLIEVKSTGKTDLIVSFDKETTHYIYLKAYTGVTYTGKQWKVEDGKGYEELINNNGLNSYELIQPVYTRLQGSNTLIDINTAKITYVNANNKYVYMPYYSRVNEKDGQGFRDLCVYHKGNSNISYFDFYEYKNEEEIASDAFRLKNNAAWDLAYQDYVYDNFLKVPDSLKRLRAEYEGKQVGTWQEAVQIVRNDLANRAVYTLSPGSTPVWEDFVEYFLYHQKKGYCVHFASSATLMFRLMGIPARYAEGYIVKPSGTSKEVDVTDKYAHAWVEIYVDGFGWVPIEATPGYADAVQGNGDSIETMLQQYASQKELSKLDESLDKNDLSNPQDNNKNESKTLDESNTDNQNNLNDSNKENNTNKTNTKDSNSNKAQKQKKETTKKSSKDSLNYTVHRKVWNPDDELIWRIITISMLVCGIVLVLIIRKIFLRKIYEKKSFEWFNISKPANAIKDIYKEMNRLAKYKGKPIDIHTSVSSIPLAYPSLDIDTIGYMKEIVTEALYSSHIMTEDQCHSMYDIYLKFYEDWKSQKSKRY
jgi:hypothetical protein